MDIIYRQGTAADLADIEVLVTEAVKQMKVYGIDQWDDLYPVAEDFRKDIAEKCLYVGHVNGDLAVIYTLNRECDAEYADGQWKEPEKPFCVLHRLCVSPRYQNQGIAGSTMARLEQEAKADGAAAIRLDVFTENPYALRLYQHCGYQRTGRVYWRKGAFDLMEKYL